MKEQDRIWTLLARKLAEEATEKELEELQELLKKYPETGYSLQVLADLWQAKEKKEEEEAEDAFELHFIRMEERAPQSAPQPAPQCTLQPARQRPAKKPGIFFLLAQTKDLLKNYFTIAWRGLSRNKGFSTINISGLTIGIASAIVLLLWIQNELSFDQFHKNKDRIYEVLTRAVVDGKVEVGGSTPQLLAPVLKENYPRQVEEVNRINWVGAFIFSVGDRHLETQGLLTDPNFFTFFSFPLIKGDPATALRDPHSLVLTEKLARKLFGNADPMGHVIKVDSIAYFTVTAVVKDLPPNTQFRFEYLAPWNYMKEVGWESKRWEVENIRTYVLLQPGISETDADNSFVNIIRNHDHDLKSELFLHPMPKWRLYSEFRDGKIAGGGINVVQMLGIIAAFILLIACINYMNLSTARSMRRAREVGIRKVVGAGKGSLVGRFLGESVLIASLAGVLALGVVYFALPWFCRMIDEQLTLPYANPWFWLSGIGFIVFTGVLAGSYPAFYLSAYRPINVLKGYFKSAHALVNPRKVLVVVQFSFAISFIICTMIVYRQINYVWQRKAGYDKNKLAFVYIKGDIKKNYERIRSELLGSGVVSSATRTNSPITDIWSVGGGYEWAGKDPADHTEFVEFRTDNDFTRTMGLQLLAGRDIDIRKYPTDSMAVVLNESAVRRMGLANPVGQQIKNVDGAWHVVGVVRDFVTGSPFAPLSPVIIQGPKKWFGTISLKMNEKYTKAESIAELAAVFKKYNPDYPFEYHFVDETYASNFEGEEHFGSLATLFAGLSIFISCLGLFGLATYMAENRIKEIGVRKVLGASVARITTLLSKDFLLLVVIAFVIASPVAWYFMSKWLEDFAYRVQINGWVFVLTGLLSILIAAATVGYQAIRAALASPVKSLRTE